MTYKEAREYLRPVADSTPLAGYGAALSKAVEALEKAESLEAELAEAERRAKDRDGLFARLIDDLKLVAKEGGTPCGLCRWAYAPLPCRDGPDYPCEKCIPGGCVCHSCRDYDKWLWRGMPEVKHEGN